MEKEGRKLACFGRVTSTDPSCGRGRSLPVDKEDEEHMFKAPNSSCREGEKFPASRPVVDDMHSVTNSSCRRGKKFPPNGKRNMKGHIEKEGE